MAQDTEAQVYLYTNNSDPKKAYKNLSNAKGYEPGHFSFKDPLDSLRPVLLVTKESLGTDWWKYNYARIPKFNNRYYFARFVTQRGELMEYQLTVDALSTYADVLTQRSYELERCESNKALKMKYADAERPLQSDKIIVCKVIGNLDETSGGIYALTVAGGGSGV